jgi:hypothetical protein
MPPYGSISTTCRFSARCSTTRPRPSRLGARLAPAHRCRPGAPHRLRRRSPDVWRARDGGCDRLRRRRLHSCFGTTPRCPRGQPPWEDSVAPGPSRRRMVHWARSVRRSCCTESSHWRRQSGGTARGMRASASRARQSPEGAATQALQAGAASARGLHAPRTCLAARLSALSKPGPVQRANPTVFEIVPRECARVRPGPSLCAGGVLAGGPRVSKCRLATRLLSQRALGGVSCRLTG